MRPAGYMLKHVAPRPPWLEAPAVREICSASDCVSKPFADYIGYQRHNGFSLFDSPAIIDELIQTNGLDATGARMFYYEGYELELGWDGETPAEEGWRPFQPHADVPTDVVRPGEKRLLGYDVVTYGDLLECSPLSCNGMAKEMAVNANCLFETLDEAKRAIDDGRFVGCDEGRYCIFAVYEIDR